MMTCELTQQVPSVYLVEQVLYEVWGFTQRIAAKVQQSTETILCSTKQRSVNSVATCNVFGSLATKQLWNTAKQ